MFDIVDGSLPATWTAAYFRILPDEQYFLLSFPEWAADWHYYERLVDGEAQAVQAFIERRREIEGNVP